MKMEHVIGSERMGMGSDTDEYRVWFDLYSVFGVNLTGRVWLKLTGL